MKIRFGRSACSLSDAVGRLERSLVEEGDRRRRARAEEIAAALRDALASSSVDVSNVARQSLVESDRGPLDPGAVERLRDL